MSLEKYKQKRKTDKTPEPFAGKPTGTDLRFVIQKHAASHLHYDFRLEMEGVLKSWAIPKGPSTDPEVKRLAMMVEDHPYDYRNFEGIIPKGQYGGGTVMVWDEGTYEPAGIVAGDLKKQERHLLRQLHAGKIKFILHGKKLKGEFALIKARGRGDNGWLLLKLEDKYAQPADITLKDKSVISKKTIEQIAKTSAHIYGRTIIKKNTTVKDQKVPAKMAAQKINSQLNEKPQEPKPVKKVTKAMGQKGDSIAPAGKQLGALLARAGKRPFFSKVKPMLATLADKAFEKEGWLYEVKWDGYRAIAFRNKKRVELKSRNDKSFNDKFYPVYEALKNWEVNAVVDGEIVVVSDKGRADFGALQNWRSEADGTLLYYLFDILWYNGNDLRDMALADRKAILAQIVPAHTIIQLSRDFEVSGTEFLAAAKKMGLEGIMAKRKDSIYHAGDRTRDWLKIKANKRQEVVIGGYTRNAGSSKPFSSLLVGVFDKRKFVYTGKIGTGFSLQQQKELLKQFKPLITGKPLFNGEPDVNKPSRFRPGPPIATVTWLKPELICEVSFTEMTADGVMRHPSFEGMREDKQANEVVLEKEADTDKIVGEGHEDSQLIQPAAKGGRKTLLNPKDDSQVRTVGGHELKFTHLGKIFWPADKITKRELIHYYYQATPFILPYLKDRPQSMNRFPNGITGKSFYQKDVTGKIPDWMDTYAYHSEGDGKDKQYLLGNNEATLLYMANQGCIEMNPWSSTANKPDRPTWCMIDFDPDKNTFEQVIEAARITHELLEDMGISSYPKTSGSTGLHIYIPLGAKYTYEQSKELARIIVTLVHREIPEYTTLERAVRDREGKMYLDFLQNRQHATIAAPYSVRPKPGATVSMPLHWEEVKKGLKMKDFTIRNAIARMKNEGDIFKPVLGKGIDLRKMLKAANGKS